MLSRLKKPAQALILLLALLFIVLLLRSQWQALRTYTWRLRPLWLLPATLAIFASWSIEVAIWRRLLQAMGARLPFDRAFRIWFVSALVRYIPGNLWQPLGMTMLARQQGIRSETTVLSIAVYQAINLLSVTIVAAFYPLFGGDLGLLAGVADPRLGLLLLVPALVFVLRPQWLLALLNWALAKMGRPPFSGVLRPADILQALFMGALDWVLLGLGFASLTLALHSLTAEQLITWLPHLVASYPLAYAIGYLSFITPSGLAVREGSLFLLLSPITGGAVATVAALAMRLWLLVCELLAAALALLTWPATQPRPWK